MLAGCEAGKPPARPEDLQGPRLTQAIPRPDLTLTHSNGRPLDFRTDTRGTLTFLFFGYTHCPDVCPLHMANLAAALRDCRRRRRSRFASSLVTTDPERDTPDGRHLAREFRSAFIGARGSPQVLEAAQRSLGMPVASRDAQVPDSGGYTVSHGAHLLHPDDSAHVVYPMGMGRQVLAPYPDLLRLWPCDTTAAAPCLLLALLISWPVIDRKPTAPRQAISPCWAAMPLLRSGPKRWPTFPSRIPDALSTPSSRWAHHFGHGTYTNPVGRAASCEGALIQLVMPGGMVVEMAPGDLHLMLLHLRVAMSGKKLPLRLWFARAGLLEIELPITRYGEPP